MIAWRPALRSACAYLMVVVPLVLLFFVVAVSRAPDAAWVQRLTKVAVLGVVVDAVRSRFLPPQGAAPEMASSADVPRGPPQSPLGQTERESLFVGIGALLRRAPDASSQVVRKTRRLGEYAVVSRRAPNWVEVELPGSARGSAWLDLDAPRDLTPPLGSEPLPPQPVAARRAEERVVKAARREMQRGARSFERFGYTILSDVDDQARLDRWLGLLAGIEERYAARYGVTPVGDPLETLAIFTSEAAYREFQEQVEGLEGLSRGVSTGHASGGMAALFVGARSGGEVGATLVHEVAHLLTRRAIGPALPLWLDEGLAEDFAYFSGPSARPLAQYRSRQGNQIRIWGPLAGLQLLQGLEERPPPLRRLFAFDLDLFVRSQDAAALYTQSAFLVAFLLADDFGRFANDDASGEAPLMPPPQGFRSFLHELANGSTPSLRGLVTALQEAQAQVPEAPAAAPQWSEETLQRHFDRYLELVYRNTPGLEP